MWLWARLLHSQYLDGILTGLTPYRLPLHTLNEYPEPRSWNISGSERENLPFSMIWKKTRVPGMGGKWWEKNRVQELWDSVFFITVSPPCLGLSFFQNTKSGKSSLSHFLKFFWYRVLYTHLGCQAAARTGSALSKFHLSVGDGATYCGPFRF